MPEQITCNIRIQEYTRIREQIAEFTIEDCAQYIDIVEGILTEETRERLVTSLYHACRARAILNQTGNTQEENHAADLLYQHNLNILRTFVARIVADAETYEQQEQQRQGN